MPDDGFDSRHQVERAKGALMLQFGIGSHQAFALLLGWSRERAVPVEELARVLVRGVVEEDPATLKATPELVGWLEHRLTGDLLEAGPLPSLSDPATVTGPRLEPLPGGTARGRHSRS
jgi:hypothetical protein